MTNAPVPEDGHNSARNIEKYAELRDFDKSQTTTKQHSPQQQAALQHQPANCAHPRRRALVCLASSLLAGACWALSFPPFGWGALAWFVPVLLLAGIWFAPQLGRYKKALFAFSCGWLCGLVAFGTMFCWIRHVSFVGYVLLAMYLALYPGLFAMLVGVFARPHALYLPAESPLAETKRWAYRQVLPNLSLSLAVACLWIVIEWLRGWVFSGFGWNGLGVALRYSLAMWQLAEFIGGTALAIIPVFVGSSMLLVFRRIAFLFRRNQRTMNWDFNISMAVLMLVYTVGIVRYFAFDQSKLHDGNSKTLNALLIQPSISQEQKRDEKLAEDSYERMYELTSQGLEQNIHESFKRGLQQGEAEIKHPDWVIWPESSLPVPWYVDNNFKLLEKHNDFNLDFFAQRIQPLQKQYGNFSLISGSDYFEVENNSLKNLYNALQVIDEQSAEQQYYFKHHLVPFGEYLPLREQLPVMQDIYRKLSGLNIVDFKSGKELQALATKQQIGIIPSICFEDTVARLTRHFVRDEPQVIVNVTNDAWFLNSAAQQQHYWNASLRCVELRRAMLRSANNGVSACIAPNGQTLAMLSDAKGDVHAAGSLNCKLRVASQGGLTLYALAGDWFILAAALFLLSVPAGKLLLQRLRGLYHPRLAKSNSLQQKINSRMTSRK